MSKSSLMTGLRFVVVLTMVVGVVSLLSHTASLHKLGIFQPIEEVRHSSLSNAAVDRHDVHGEGRQKECQANHDHGHNSADHSHETMGSAVILAALGCADEKTSRSEPHRSTYGEPFFRLDRPPRHGFPT